MHGRFHPFALNFHSHHRKRARPSNLIHHYAETLGAELLNPRSRVMAIDGQAALTLVKRYYGGEQ